MWLGGLLYWRGGIEPEHAASRTTERPSEAVASKPSTLRRLSEWTCSPWRTFADSVMAKIVLAGSGGRRNVALSIVDELAGHRQHVPHAADGLLRHTY